MPPFPAEMSSKRKLGFPTARLITPIERRAQQHTVLLLDRSGGLGGPAAHLYYMLKYLNKERFRCIVTFYFYNNGPDTQRIRDLGIPIMFLKKDSECATYERIKRFFGASDWKWIHKCEVLLRLILLVITVELPILWRLLKIIRREAIDLIVLNSDVHYHAVGALAARISRVPCICRKAGGIGEGQRIKPFLTPWIDLFIAISRATAADQLKNNPGTKRLVTIYEGIDVKGFAPTCEKKELRTSLDIPSGKKVVGYVARVVNGKGHKEFLEAAALVVKSYRDVVFLIVGDDGGQEGRFLKDLKSEAKLLGVGDHTIFTGWRTDIPAILGCMDIFVHCPTTFIEGLGLANLEAMAMGKPTVVSNNGGLPDAVLDGVTGFVVPPGDIRRLADAILRLLEDEGLALRLGRNARERAEKEFDIEKNMEKIEEVFEEYALRHA